MCFDQNHLELEFFSAVSLHESINTGEKGMFISKFNSHAAPRHSIIRNENFSDKNEIHSMNSDQIYNKLI